MAADRLTVVIPAHNSADTLPKAIESVRRQHNAPGIIVVVDGADPDTQTAASAYPEVRIRANRERVGAAASRNVGLALVETEFVAFLDADDYIEGDLHHGMADALAEADMVISSLVKAQPDGRRTLISAPSVEPLLEDPGRLAAHWLGTRSFQTGSLGWRTDFLRDIGGWDASLRRAQEFELGLRSITKGGRIKINTTGFAVHVNHDDPTRISMVKTATVLDDHVRIITNVLDYAKNKPFESIVWNAAGRRYYALAAKCYFEAAPEEGRWALMQARSLGVAGHQGTFLHRLACNVVGLERKQKLSQMVAAIKSGTCRGARRV